MPCNAPNLPNHIYVTFPPGMSEAAKALMLRGHTQFMAEMIAGVSGVVFDLNDDYNFGVECRALLWEREMLYRDLRFFDDAANGSL
ncbi:hypothetical protein TWF281_004475 [Arthrobotrys megalospora]